VSTEQAAQLPSTSCPVCGREMDVHTVAEWKSCLAQTATDLPYEPVAAPMTVDGEFPFADHVTARAAMAQAGPAVVGVLLLQFGQSNSGAVGGVDVVGEVALVGTPAVLRRAGTIIRDTANAAANQAERSGG
jgi:hypothetical protein